MDKKSKEGSKVAEITGKVVAVLEPLESADRQKVIRASLTLLGEAPVPPTTDTSRADAQGGGSPGRPEHGLGALPAKAKSWASQNELTMAQIEQVYDVSGGDVSVIAAQAPGNSGKEMTHSAYVLQGIGRLLAMGEPVFDDKDARKLCEDLGCYNAGNHSTYMDDKGNMLTGSKKTGWKLTAPGLKRGAELVKELTKKE